MVSALEPDLGRWLHFTRYELIDGGIRPARDAELVSSSPWYDAPRQVPAYQSLANLVRGLSYPPDAEGAERILGWVAQHGVLGVLPHETVAVTLAPRWQPAAEYFERGKRLPVLPSSTTYYQLGGRFDWQRRSARTSRITGVFDLAEDTKLRGELVDRRTLMELERSGAGLPRAEVVRRPVGGGLQVAPLGAAWGRYFPTIPIQERSTWDYPQPLSDRFWRYYVEPLDEFLAAADQLRQGLEELAAAPHGYERAGGPTLARLLTPVSLGMSAITGELGEAWSGPSLLSMLSARAVVEVTRGGRVHICHCRTLFVSDDRRVEYCSPRCRKNAQQGAWRARKRQRAAASPAPAPARPSRAKKTGKRSAR